MNRILLGVIAILIVAIFVVPSLAEASSQIVFTTTADFNAGNKTDPGAEWFAANGVDQPQNQASWPRAIESSVCGKMYNVWQAVTDPHAQAWIASYDHAGKWVANRIGTDILEDGHGTPAIGITGDGYLHVFYGGHNTEEFYYRSTVPCDSTAFTKQTSISSNATYPQILTLSNGTLLIFYRKGFAGSTGTYVIRWSENSGNSWSAERILVDFGAFDSIYAGNLELFRDRIWFAFSKYSGGLRTSLYSVFLNLSTQHMISGFGNDLGFIMDETEADTFCRNVDTGSKEVLFPILHIDPRDYGHPMILYNVQNGTIAGLYDFNFTRETSPSAWTNQKFIRTTGHTLNTNDFRILGTMSVRAYIVASVRQIESGNLEQWDWMTGNVDDLGTWVLTKTILKGASVRGLAAPQFVRYDNTTLLFNERWFSGPANAKLYAYSTSTGMIRNRAIQSGTWGVETISDNPSVVGGSFVLANGISDSFNYTNQELDTFKFKNIDFGSNIQAQNHSIGSGIARMSLSSTSANARVSAYTKFSLASGADFDVEMRSDQITVSSNFNFLYFFGVSNEAIAFPHKDQGGTLTDDAFFMTHSASTDMHTWTTRNGDQNLTNPVFYVASNLIWFRVTRTGSNVLTSYYRTTDNGAWTQDASVTFVIAGDITIFFGVGTTLQAGNFEVDFSKFRINVGSVNDADTYSGYRHSGSWISSLQTAIVNEVEKTITVGYSGATANRYIDEVSILTSAGDVLYRDTTNHPSGSSATISIPDELLLSLDGINYRIGVTLKGDGTGSVSILDVTVKTVRSPLAKTFDAFWLILFGVVITLVVIGAYKIRMWGE